MTRFAPSPTGALHVGGARTALFNWAFARGPASGGTGARIAIGTGASSPRASGGTEGSTGGAGRAGGQFIIRIEDTDQARSTPQATRGILEDLKWLGIDWDQGPDPDAADPYSKQIGPGAPYFQSQRLDTYRKYCDQLLATGRAYECFKTPQELAAEREKARAAKTDWRYDRTEMISATKEQKDAWRAAGRSCVIRFRAPDHDIAIDDLVLDRVEVKADQLDDFVIFKGDGFPTYHFAVVVDDALMGVTHVIRAQEHLSNTPKHVALQEALGFPHPKYAHLPLIFNPDGTKMSKRDKAKVARQAAKAQGLQSLGFDEERYQLFLAKKNDDLDLALAIAKKLGLALPEIDVADFRRSGYLPQVILNYISLLGWNPGENVEKFDTKFLAERFSFDRVGKSNSKFDRDKLRAFNGDALRALPVAEFEAKLLAHGQQYYPDSVARLNGNFSLFAGCYRERSTTLDDPYKMGRFMLIEDDAIQFDAKAMDKAIKKDAGKGAAMLTAMEPVLANVMPWEPAAIHAAIEAFAKEKSVGMGDVAQPLRVAVTGTAVSPPIDATLAILGRLSTLTRMRRCVEAAK